MDFTATCFIGGRIINMISLYSNAVADIDKHSLYLSKRFVDLKHAVGVFPFFREFLPDSGKGHAFLPNQSVDNSQVSEVGRM